MFTILKFFHYLLNNIWSILNPNLNALKNAPTSIKYTFTVLLACFWSLTFCLYTAQFFFIGVNMMAHVAVISMIFLTWSLFRFFKMQYPQIKTPPLMRDPKREAKCYELTSAEIIASMNRADQLLVKPALIA